MFVSSTIPAKVIAGIPRRKENLAASWRCQPFSRAALNVIPDRETPGMIASTCASPIKKPFSRITIVLSERKESKSGPKN